MSTTATISPNLEALFQVLDPKHIEFLAPKQTLVDSTENICRIDPGLRTLQIGLVRQHLEASPELATAKNELGRTVLHEAAYHGADWLLAILVSAGADLEAEDDNGHTPLMEAVIQAEALVVERLLDFGADSEHRTKENYSAIDLAIDQEYQDPWIVRLLTGMP